MKSDGPRKTGAAAQASRPGSGTESQATENRRHDERRSLDADVLVRVLAQELQGPSQNVSAEGLYFTAKASLPVEVTLPDGSLRTGQLLRVGAVREGELGLAVRFDEPLSPDELP